MTGSKRILIVGGVAGGASAAARARRISEDAEIILFERGDAISFANCGLPYHIGGDIPERSRLLVQTPESMRRRFLVDVRTRTEVISIDPEAKTIRVRDMEKGNEYDERYDSLILSPGADPVKPPVKGIDSPGVFTLRSLADMDAIKKASEAGPAKVLVAGAGYIGLEMVEALRKKGHEVMLVELAPQVMNTADPEMTAPLKRELSLQGVELRLNTSLTEIIPGENNLDAVLSTGERITRDMLILSVGIRPESALARDAGLTLGPTGGIVVDKHMRTSDPSIFAVGDAVEVEDFVAGTKILVPLAGPANRQGRIAADNALGRDSVYRGTQGSSILRLFGTTIAMTGLTEKTLIRHGRPYEKIYIHPSSHASYYPGANPITLKLLFDPSSGRVLGAQAVGSSGIDKRIDVLAAAVHAGMTVYDLEHLELSYAPPYGSAKDPVNYAGFVAANVLRGDVKIRHYRDLVDNPDIFILDVRTTEEVRAGTIPGAVNIPVDELRGRLEELPRDREIAVFCQVGLRAYIACRMLSQKGFDCSNFSGGYRTWSAFTDEIPVPCPSETDMRDDTGECTPSVIVPTPQPQELPLITIDATGLQCPGPIMRLKNELQPLKQGEGVLIKVSDPGFVQDIPAWCSSTGNTLVSIEPAEQGAFAAKVIKGAVSVTPSTQPNASKKKTIVIFSNDFDRVMAAFVIANGAASMGSDVTLFFTFWGLNVLRQSGNVKVKKNLIEKMFGMMMPQGAGKLTLSKMNMGGMGLAMMKGIMKKKNVNTLDELVMSARDSGVRLVACSMTMDIMGIKKEELIEGVEIGGVAMYLANAEAGNVNLFI